MGEFLRDLWQFMRVRKKYWLLPIILVLVPCLYMVLEDLRISERPGQPARQAPQ